MGMTAGPPEIDTRGDFFGNPDTIP
jgi:hypothetical protein